MNCICHTTHHLILIKSCIFPQIWSTGIPKSCKYQIHTLWSRSLFSQDITPSNKMILKSKSVFLNLSSNSPPRTHYWKGQSLTLHCECAYLGLEKKKPSRIFNPSPPVHHQSMGTKQNLFQRICAARLIAGPLGGFVKTIWKACACLPVYL